MSEISACGVLVVCTAAFSMLGGAPAQFQIYGISAVGIVTAASMGGALLLIAFRPVISWYELRLLWPLIIFWVYDLVSTFWSPLSLAVAQDTVIWGGVLFLILISARAFRSGNIQVSTVFKLFDWSTYFFISYGLYLIFSGSTKVVVFSVLFVIITCYQLIRWKAGFSWGLYIGATFFVVNALTSSRTPAAVCLGLFVLLEIISGKKGRWSNIFFVGGGLMTVGVILFLYYPPLRQSFLQGDNALQIGDVAINTAGRIHMWQLTIESWLTSPWIGLGIDAPPKVLYAGGQGHPHNDYLRLLHHLGVFGLISWLLFYVRTTWYFWESWKRNRERLGTSPAVQLVGTAFMASVAVGVIMLTDNTIVYSSIMYPLAILIGASIGVVQSKLR